MKLRPTEVKKFSPGPQSQRWQSLCKHRCSLWLSGVYSYHFLRKVHGTESLKCAEKDIGAQGEGEH